MSYVSTSSTGAANPDVLGLSGAQINQSPGYTWCAKIQVNTVITIKSIVSRDMSGSFAPNVTPVIYNASGGLVAKGTTGTLYAGRTCCFKFTTPVTLQPNTDYYIGFYLVSTQYSGPCVTPSANYSVVAEDATFNITQIGYLVTGDGYPGGSSYTYVPVIGINYSVGTVDLSPKPIPINGSNYISVTPVPQVANVQRLALLTDNYIYYAANSNIVRYSLTTGTLAGNLSLGNQVMGVIQCKSDNHLIVPLSTGYIYDVNEVLTSQSSILWAFGVNVTIYGMLQLKSGKMLVFGINAKVQMLNSNLTSVASLTLATTGITLSNYHIYSAIELSDGNILLGLQGGYIVKINTDLQVLSYAYLGGSYNIRNLLELSNGNIVVSSDNSISVYNLTTAGFVNGWQGTTIAGTSQIVETRNGLLVSGSGGISDLFILMHKTSLFQHVYFVGDSVNGSASAISGLSRNENNGYVGITQAGGFAAVYQFNTAPNKPVINNPVGTSASPAIITTTTPTLSWSFSDPDTSDAQSAYQVQILDSNDNIIYDTGKVVSTATSVQVPSGYLAVASAAKKWRVCTWDSDGTVGNYSDLNYFTILTTANIGDSKTFNYTGAAQTYTVPANVTKIKLEAWGAQGGDFQAGSKYGKGGYTYGEVTVTPGQVLNIYVGGKGGDATSSITTTTPGGWNGGGTGGYGSGAGASAGGGGGATDIRTATTLASRILVAAGGGGGASVIYKGGDGGGLTGGTPAAGEVTGGTQTAGGTGGTNGTLGAGGGGTSSVSGMGSAGGGGGYYGGGGGTIMSNNGYPGGGGSSYYGSLTNASTTAGMNTGDGKATITVVTVSSLATIATRTPGSTDPTKPTGTSLTPTLNWTFSGSYTQSKFQVKIYQGNTLVKDSGLLPGAQPAYAIVTGILQPGIVYGWELQVTDINGVVTPTDRIYFITNYLPGTPTNLVPLDASRQTLKPTLSFTMGDDVENDNQHFIIKLATDSGFTQDVQTFDTRNDVTGWTYDDGQAFPNSGLDYTHEGHTVSYTLQNNLVEGTLYYWKVAPIDGTTNGVGTYSKTKTLKAGNRLEVTLKDPIQTTAEANRILIKVLRNLATDGANPAMFKVYACNNALDATPTWEEVTDSIVNSNYHTFTNTANTVANWAINIKIIVEANDSTGPLEILGFGFSFD